MFLFYPLELQIILSHLFEGCVHNSLALYSFPNLKARKCSHTCLVKLSARRRREANKRVRGTTEQAQVDHNSIKARTEF